MLNKIIDTVVRTLVVAHSTLETIESINGLYEVRYIDTLPDYTNFIAFSDSPITINNTNYSTI